jgi:chemotaxis signal transduction protein
VTGEPVGTDAAAEVEIPLLDLEAAALPDLARQVMLVRVGGARFGLVVEDVAGVLEEARLSAVPKAPAGVLGIMNHVGSVLTVVDLAAVLGRAETSEPVGALARRDDASADRSSGAAAPRFVVVVERKDDRIGLRVDRVEGITLTVDLARDLEPEPGARLSRGRLTYEGEAVRLLDGAAIVDEVLARFERRDRRA